MADRTRIRRSQVRTIEVTRRTDWGPKRDHGAVVAVTEWPNGEGIDVGCALGPHDSGSMRLTWDEAQALRVALEVAMGGQEDG